MAEEKASPDAGESKPASRKKLLMPAVIGGVMLLEGVGILGAMKMFGAGADSAPAQSIEALEADQTPQSVEIEIAEFKALNEKSGMTLVVDIRVAARVAADKAEEIESEVRRNKATIVDRLALAVRSADSPHLKEVDLATIKQKMKAELKTILKDDELLEELLITRFQKFRADI